MPSLKDLFLKNVAQTSDSPLLLEIERAEGIYLYNQEGKQFTDLISGISVSSVGHSHPLVVQAIIEQTKKHLHLMVYGEYIQSPQVKLAFQLSELSENILNSVYFVNSGSEAIEGSIKLAKRFTGKKEVIACENAYHGSTIGAMSLINHQEYTKSFSPLMDGVSFIRFNHPEDAEKISDRTACVIIEPIQGEAGYIPATKEFLQTIKNKCSQTQTLLIFDEVQCGFGRTGSFFAFQDYQITPDILVLAKALGGGMPLGAFMAKKEIMNCLSFNPALGHISTFGGHPVSCAASLATIDVIMNEKLAKQTKQKENLFRNLLLHKQISEIRGKGLMLALELNSADHVKICIAYCLEKGVIIDWFLFCDTAIRISPPLIITEEQIHSCCQIILDSLDSLEN